jgi:transposase
MRSWVPDDDLVHFVLLAVEGVPLSTFSVNHRGSGSEQYPPRMLLALLIYCYANGIFSSRRIERATYRDVGVRYLTGDTHPDHDTICKFRRENCDAVGAAFLEVLRLARELNVLKVGTISIDGTHIKANASRFHALSYHRACELDEQLRLEIDSLLKKAEEADSTGAGDPQQLPEELAHRQKLHRKVAEARQALEKRAAVAAASEQAEYERKLRERDQRPGPRKGPEPKAPDPTPSAGDQINLTDADSRIMRSRRQTAEDTEGPAPGADAGQAEDRHRKSLVRQAETDRGTGFRRHQTSHGIPSVPASGMPKRLRRMATGVPCL